jgi:hypothetical protein
MAFSRKHVRGGRGFAAPLFGIIFLVACYWILAEWQELPAMIGATLSVVHWPI